MTTTAPTKGKKPIARPAVKKTVSAPKRTVPHRAAPAHNVAVHAPSKTASAGATGHKNYDYTFAVGRRKEAVARVRLYSKGSGKITINEREFTKYFPVFDLQLLVQQPLKITSTDGSLDVGVRVLGGGNRGQADAVRHGIARALVKLNEEFRQSLRAAGCLTRDSRVKERKKYGLKKARRAPQFSKR